MGRVTAPTIRFTYDEFVRLVESDAFGTTRVELLNGRIHFMTQRRPHMVAISKGAELLQRLGGPTEWILIQGTLRLDRFSAPDPDLVWLSVPLDTPEHLWPSPVLVIEISDTTYRKDSGTKLRKYAQAKVSDYWIENLPADRVEVYRDPRNPTGRVQDCGYASVEHFKRGESIPLLNRPGTSICVDDLLPPRAK